MAKLLTRSGSSLLPSPSIVSASLSPLLVAFLKLLAFLHVAFAALLEAASQACDDVAAVLQSLPRTARMCSWALQAGLAYKRFRATTKLDPESDEFAAAMEAMHTHWATKLAAVARANGGVYVKFGQFAISVGQVPPEYRRVLAQLEDKAHPRPYEEVEKMLLSELGLASSGVGLVGDPAHGAVFSEFNREATAAASLAQVHRARLANGQEVAVKLQYPGLRRSVRADLRSMRVMSATAAALFPEYSLTWLYEEMKAKLEVEMDFRTEIKNANQLRAILERSMGRDAAAYVPRIYEHLSTERMIIMEWIQGIKLTDAQELRRHKINPHAVGLALVRLFADLMMVQGYVHGDPHPGNLMVRPKGKRSFFNWLFRGTRQRFEIVLLDHGSYLTVSPELREQFCQLWCSFVTGDKRVQADISVALAGERAGRVLPMLLTHQAQRKEFKALQRSVGINTFGDISSMLSSAPRDLVELLRINAVIRSSSTLLGVTMAERKRVVTWFARRGLPPVWASAAHVHASTRSMLYRTRLIVLLLAWSSWTYTSGVATKVGSVVRRVFCGRRDGQGDDDD